MMNNSNREEYNNLDYVLKFLSVIYAVKHGKKTMPFPEFVKMSAKKIVEFRRKDDVK